MRSEPSKKNKWLNRKPLDKTASLWYNKDVDRDRDAEVVSYG